jgi:hypothetical protein
LNKALKPVLEVLTLIRDLLLDVAAFAHQLFEYLLSWRPFQSKPKPRKPAKVYKEDAPPDIDNRKHKEEHKVVIKKADHKQRLPIPENFKTPFPKPKPDPFVELFGPDIKKLTFKQHDVGDCYLLAGIDALLHHPAGEALLRKIRIEPRRDAVTNQVLQYQVTFPTGRQITFEASELGKIKSGKRPVEGPPVIQILEMAYAKMTREARNARRPSPLPNGGEHHTMVIVEAGHSHDALQDMFGGEKLKITAREPYVPGTIIHATDALNKHPNGLHTLETFLQRIADDRDHHTVISAYTPNELPAGQDNPKRITLIRTTGAVLAPLHVFRVPLHFHRGHAYSIRNFDMANRTITIANPHDTSRQETLTFEEFCKVFRGITGIRLPKTDAAMAP